MARGELVPDDVVVAIVVRPDRPARRQARLHPRRLSAHRAAGRGARPDAGQSKGLRLDAVIELKVDPGHPGPPDREPGRADASPRRAAAGRRQSGGAQAAAGGLSRPRPRRWSPITRARARCGRSTAWPRSTDVTAAIGRALADAAFRPVAHPQGCRCPARPPRLRRQKGPGQGQERVQKHAAKAASRPRLPGQDGQGRAGGLRQAPQAGRQSGPPAGPPKRRKKAGNPRAARRLTK